MNDVIGRIAERMNGWVGDWYREWVDNWWMDGDGGTHSQIANRGLIKFAVFFLFFTYSSSSYLDVTVIQVHVTDVWLCACIFIIVYVKGNYVREQNDR